MGIQLLSGPAQQNQHKPQQSREIATEASKLARELHLGPHYSLAEGQRALHPIGSGARCHVGWGEVREGALVHLREACVCVSICVCVCVCVCASDSNTLLNTHTHSHTHTHTHIFTDKSSNRLL